LNIQRTVTPCDISVLLVGSLVCIVMREEFLNIVKGHADQLEPEMERLEHEG